MTNDWKSAVNPAAAQLTPYVPARLPGICHRLDANEAPAELLHPVQDVLARAAGLVGASNYPDARASALRESLATWTGASAENLVVGSGSDEIIAMVALAFSRPRPGAGRAKPVMLLPTPTFVMYGITGSLHGFDVIEVPLNAAFELDETAMRAAIDEHSPNIIFLASPNNPTGAAFAPDAIERLARHASGSLVVLDEAYGPFSSRQLARSPSLPENLVRIGTLSKIGLASLRIGWLEASPAIARVVDCVRLPFNTSATSQAIASAVLAECTDHLRAMCTAIVLERDRVASALERAGGAIVHPSDANFLWLEVPGEAATVWKKLAGDGILVRNFAGNGGRLDHCLRVTIGAQAANDAFLAAWGPAIS